MKTLSKKFNLMTINTPPLLDFHKFVGVDKKNLFALISYFDFINYISSKYRNIQLSTSTDYVIRVQLKMYKKDKTSKDYISLILKGPDRYAGIYFTKERIDIVIGGDMEPIKITMFDKPDYNKLINIIMSTNLVQFSN